MNFITLVIIGVGLVQLPLIFDFLLSFLPTPRMRRLTQRYVARVLFALILVLALTGFAVFFLLFLPVTVSDAWKSPLGWMHIAFASLTWGNMAYNYIRASFSDPGVLKAPTLASDSEEPQASTPTFCGKCKITRPEHTHHCAECGCVRFMDHHCPFTMNCVGIHNYAYFYIFLLHASVGLAYASLLTLPVFAQCWLSFDNYNTPLCMDLGTTSLMFIPALGLFGVVFGLFMVHTVLLLANMTTVDFFLSVRKGAGIIDVLTEGYKKRVALPPQANTKAKILLLSQRPHLWQYVIPFSEPKVKQN